MMSGSVLANSECGIAVLCCSLGARKAQAGGPLAGGRGQLRIPARPRGWKTHGARWARETVPAKNINKFKKGLEELKEE